MKLCILLFIALLLLTLVDNKLLASNNNSVPDQPVIKFNHESTDLGKVKEGAILYHSFKVKNIGGKTLQIAETKSTCGCTVPVIKKSVLPPFESTTLKVQIDTSMKQNKVIKTLDVLSSDPKRPKVTLSIAMYVENRHKKQSQKSRAKILTEEKCMSCHVYKGVGTFGKDLYEADCAMCHASDGTGASGPNLLLGGYKNAELVQSRRKVIACGSTMNNSMPGFEYTCGGPLSKEQIDSLIEFLKSLSESY